MGHVFFSDEINVPLLAMLQENESSDEILKYCRFIEEMWKDGTDDVVNIVDVTILERLSDEETVWEHFGKNISDEFKVYINDEFMIFNKLLMHNVKKL